MTIEELEQLEKLLRKTAFSPLPEQMSDRQVLETCRQLIKYYIQREQHEAEAYDGPTAQE